jgi:hypothetical protein
MFVIGDSALAEAARAFLNEYRLTYTTSKQKTEPHDFRAAFSGISDLHGQLAKDVSVSDLERVQVACHQVYMNFNSVNNNPEKFKLRNK